jgi:hypothetical protein
LPAEQEVVPLAFVQIVPQAPQLFTLVLVLVSQPSFLLPLQSPKPAEQTGLHLPAEQALVPFTAWQTVPQAPQFVALV